MWLPLAKAIPTIMESVKQAAIMLDTEKHPRRRLFMDKLPMKFFDLVKKCGVIDCTTNMEYGRGKERSSNGDMDGVP